MRDAAAGQDTLSREDYAGLLIDRLAAAIVDDSLPLKDVERELRGCVADVGIRRRGLGKKETASRCGVTEKSIENYLKEVRNNPKSPEREVARVLQDRMLTLEEIHGEVRPVIDASRAFTLDDAKRALDKLIRTGEVVEYSGHRYRAVERPSIRYPRTVDAHRELVDQKARDLDYIILAQKEAEEDDVVGRRNQRYSRVVRDTNLVRVDFTVDVEHDRLPAFYERLSEGIAKLTMKYEKKNASSRVRLLIGMRAVTTVLALGLGLLFAATPMGAQDGKGADSWELDQLIFQVPAEWRDEEHAPRLGSLVADGTRAGETAARDRPPGPRHVSLLFRGDVDRSLRVDVNDGLLLARYVTGSVPELPCPRTADVDANGRVEVTDVLRLFEVLYAGGSIPPIVEEGGDDVPVGGCALPPREDGPGGAPLPRPSGV